MTLVPFAVPAVVVATAPESWNRSEQHQRVASLPLPPTAQLSSDRLWVRVRQPAPLARLADLLNVPGSRLAALNEVKDDHQFSKGDWLTLPSSQARLAKLLPQLDGADLRRTPPLHDLPPVETNGVVRFGDSLRKIAKRYGMTLQELLRQNPGIETARLVVGAPIKVVQSSPARPRLLLGLKPTGSGGLSWPELPDFGGDEDGDRDLSAHGWIWPTRGMFSSGFGWRWGRMHKGIDIANNVGTQIVAAKDGVVSFAGWHGGGYGYLVTLSHPDGSRSLYAHNSRILVREGQEVEQGEQISQMGSTGRSTGPHLHFEIHPAGRGAVNPLSLLPQRA
ncbi:MAG: M23 family metallopeptidase [Cyanobacteriota bacterium]|nr:M23 family metallopeptidase [Cyanobacteriota bacterium]